MASQATGNERKLTTSAAAQRGADPYGDLDVIDERAPRVNQAVVGVVALLGVFFGWPLAWALLALQLLAGLTLGRRFCLACLAYFQLIQPRIGEGALEDARPPRLANQMGFWFLSAAAAAWWIGVPTLGVVLAAIVSALALLAATTGFCTGCELYKIRARVQGISPGHATRLDPADLGGLGGVARTFVEFTHPLCSECHDWERRLDGGPEPLVKVNVKARPELARKYGIAIVPTVVAVSSEGVVLERLAP